MRLSVWPRSLAGQIALLLAIALFVAQAINFTLLLRERRVVRFTQVTVPAITRIVDAAERLQSGRAPSPERPRSRVRLVPVNPISPGAERLPDVEEGVENGLREAGLRFGRVVTGIEEVPRNARLERRMSPARAERLRRIGTRLTIAVEQPGSGWLVLEGPWPRTERSLIWQLVAQTLILYAVLLLPVLWIAHRISRPLRALASAARAFRPGAEPQEVPERGPGDVRAVIAAYNELGRRVSAMLDEKDRMLGAIGHDLRTPLAALRVRIESVEDEGDRARMADIIDEMNRTLEDILSLARLGRPSEPVTEVDLSALVDAVVEDFRDLGAKVELEETPRLRVRIRPSLMRRAVRNLIENAVKYAGGAEVRLAPQADRVAIEVCDRGPGIPPDKLETVFDPFTRIETSRNRETGGIGLGLALARAIVREAGGDIRLANRAGGGLVAAIELPR